MQHLQAGVSATALTVAAARAIATADPASDFDDPFARRFVTASGHPELPLELDRASPDAREFWERISSYLAARSRAFDAALLDSVANGCRQVAVVAAGLDARAYRLDWPDGIRLFEIDREPVLAFKDRVLAGHAPRIDRRVIASDVAHDWPGALLAAGFDASLPTAWLVEGLLPYLPAALETSLLDGITAQSAPGSRLALEFIRRPEDADTLDSGSGQIAALFDPGPRPDSVAHIRDAGWDVHTQDVSDLVTWAFARRA